MAFYQQAEQIKNDSIWTFEDRTVRKYTAKQAYEHAAMVFRARTGKTDRVVYPAGVYDTFDTNVVLTAVDFAVWVHSALQGLYDYYER